MTMPTNDDLGRIAFDAAKASIDADTPERWMQDGPTMTDPQPLRHPLIATDRRCDTIRPKQSTIIGTLIRSRRETLGVSQGKLAQALTCDRSTVSYWEGGRMMPEVDKVPALAAALDLPVADLALALCGINPASYRDTVRAELVPVVRAEVLATVTLALGDVGEEAA